ncbi:bifunctional cyclohexadienyl dehydrogenase/ 3-phosphoshikimate 1-carboxyvinyltransferase [Pseudomonas aeruginosa]|nr:bifunctional cyclohexadienyl dehydrogenase/ 3-phosphoshikimate 1-carboxyvinyltransferase [Pseudomonas aeruginosa]
MFREVVGVDRDAESCRLAVELGVVDRCEEDLGRACVGADVIQLAVPILAMERVLADLAKLDLGKAVLTDVGSAKGNIVRAARVAFGGMPRYLVPGHPIAGSEQSGVTAAKATLFRRHKVILTPSAETDADALALVDSLWRALGADVEHMEVEHHDEVLAATSHLPHLLAFTLVDSLAKRSENLEIFRYAAGGFRDFTRIAGSDPVMWHDIFLANREAVLRTLDVFRDDLDALREAVDTGDGHQLLGVFTRARVAREHFSKILARRAYVDAMHNNDLIYLAQPGGSLSGTIRVPGDKSISHRSIMLGFPGRRHHRSGGLPRGRGRTGNHPGVPRHGSGDRGAAERPRHRPWRWPARPQRRRLGRSTWVTPVLPCVCSAVCWRPSRSTAP